MEEKKYKFTAKVLAKTKGKVSPSGKAREEANCLLTKNDLVIGTEQPIRIPVARIHDRQLLHEQLAVPESVSLGQQSTRVGPEYGAEVKPLGTLILTYFDDLNQKHRVSLEMALDDAGFINATLRDAISEAQAQVWESLPIEMKCAGFLVRFLAYFIDGIILGAINWTLMFIFFAMALGEAYVTQIITGAYFIGFWIWRGQTPGKGICGIQIIKEDGSPIGFWRAVVRYIGYYISGITLLIGFLQCRNICCVKIAYGRKADDPRSKIAPLYI